MIRHAFFALLVSSVLASAPARADNISALKAADAGNWSAAQQQAGDGVGRDLVRWMYLTDDNTRASFSEIASFVTAHPNWPSADKLFKSAETRLPNDLSSQQLVNWFGRNEPVSASGMKRYMGALLDMRQTQQAVTSLKTWWVKANLSESEQNDILNTYGQYLGTADHQRRLQRMVGDKQYTPARALAARMGTGYQRLVEARVSLQEGGKDISSRVSAIPNNLMQDNGLLLSRVQYRRENNDDAGAIQLLNQAGPANQTTDPSAWWKERHVLARRLMEQRRYKDAYKLTAAHGLDATTGADYAAAEFLAGWLALRFVNQPYAAFEHFERMFNNVQTPISRARAAYWAGRASEQMRSPDIAMQWYQVAARYQTTFYGQMAAQHINLPLNLVTGDKPVITREQKAAFENTDLVQAVKLLHRAGLSSERGQFLKAMTKNAASPQDYALMSDVAVSMGQVDQAMKIAKEAEKTGLYLIDYLFPTISATTKNAPADKALVHALIRQESQFDPNAVSSSGALGLMQIMPATGKYISKKSGIAHNTSWLTAKPEHNTQFGGWYISYLLEKFDGSMPLAIAAYNAGPGRVNQWLNQLGDPRTGQIDMMDWMESIPVYETRNYVQRVLEGYAVYQAKLGATPFGGQRNPLKVTPLANTQSANANARMNAVNPAAGGAMDIRSLHTAYNP